jgi:hypothetical protein
MFYELRLVRYRRTDFSIPPLPSRAITPPYVLKPGVQIVLTTYTLFSRLRASFGLMPLSGQNLILSL